MESLAQGDKNYQMAIRRFASGGVEVSTHCVNHMQRMAQSRRWSAHDPVKFRHEELSQMDLDRKAEENRSRSIRESKKRIRWLIKQLGADHMVTFSYRENMTDLAQLKSDWKALARLMHAKFPGWRYVAVHEYQERGALHLHVAVQGRQDIKYLRRCWYMVLGASPNAEGDETPGAINVRGPARRWGNRSMEWKTDRLSGYLTKYLHKAFDMGQASAKRYWASKGVTAPDVEKLWLGATNYLGAIQETHDALHAIAGNVDTMWASEGWQAIWMSG